MSFVDPRTDHPVKHFGGEYDEVEGSGWHVVLRDDRGDLESLAGPFPTWAEAMGAYRDLMKGVLP